MGLSNALEVLAIERRAKTEAANAGLLNWEDALTLRETRRMIELSEIGEGSWANDPKTLERMKSIVAKIDAKTDQ